MKNDISKKLIEIKFKELQDYLNENYCFGLTASKRKYVIIYFFRRYFIGIGLSLKIKVDRSTKNVISIMHKGNYYTDFNDVKNLIESKGNYIQLDPKGE